MSKRSSFNAFKFAGKLWSSTSKSKKSVKKKFKEKEKLIELNLEWEKICNELNFKISIENKIHYDRLKQLYMEQPDKVLEIYNKLKSSEKSTLYFALFVEAINKNGI